MTEPKKTPELYKTPPRPAAPTPGPSSATPAKPAPGSATQPHPQTDVGAGQEQVVKPNPDDVNAAELAAQAEKARLAGLAAPPSDSQKKADEPIPNWAVPQRPAGAAVVGDDPLAGMPPAVLEALVARVRESMGGPAAGFQVPAGMKLVSAVTPQDEKSRAEQEAFKARAEKTTTELSQEEADRLFPPLPTDAWFRCRLADGNQHPVIYLPAASAVDAGARYLMLCGIRSTDKQVSAVKQVREVKAQYRDFQADEKERLTKPPKKEAE